MEANNILKADLLDIIFENRNKAYGAYDLRNSYPARIKKALAGVCAVCLVFITGILLAKSTSENDNKMMTVKDVDLIDYVEEKKQPAIPEPPRQAQPPQRTIAVTIPNIVPDELVEQTEVPPDEAIENIRISTKTNQHGTEGDMVPPLLETGTGGTKDIRTEKENYDAEFYIVQQQAKFPGGVEAWIKHLERNLHIDIPVENGAPVGKYSVIVSFLVDKQGNVSEVQAVNDPGYGTAAEAVRVIKKSLQWIPAMQNGNKVIYRQQQSITFIVNEG